MSNQHFMYPEPEVRTDWLLVCVYFLMCGVVYVWVCVCVGFVSCGCVYMCGCVYVWV